MKKKPKLTVRKAVFTFHLWTGIILGLYFALLGLTGSILVFRNELEDAAFPELVRVEAPPGATPLKASGIVAAVRRQFPQLTDDKLATLEFPRHAGGAYGMYLDIDGRPHLVTLSPYDGRVISRFDQSQHWIAFLGNFHMYLLMESGRGLRWNTYGGVFVAVLVASGMWLWWPKLWSQVRARLKVKWKASPVRVMNDLHNVFGVYGLAFLLMASLTGAVFGVWEPVAEIVDKITQSIKRKEPEIKIVPAAQRQSLEQLVAVVERTIPDSRIGSVTYPTAPDQPLTAFKYVDQGQMLYGQITIDPYSGAVLNAVDTRDEPRGYQVMRWVQMLHFGWYGHWWSKIPYAALGLLPLGLYVTGLGRYVIRRRGKGKPKPA